MICSVIPADCTWKSYVYNDMSIHILNLLCIFLMIPCLSHVTPYKFIDTDSEAECDTSKCNCNYVYDRIMWFI